MHGTGLKWYPLNLLRTREKSSWAAGLVLFLIGLATAVPGVAQSTDQTIDTPEAGQPGAGAGGESLSALPALPVFSPNAIAPVVPNRTRAAAPHEFHAKRALNQSLVFLGLQHTFRMTEEKTTRELKGPFFKDWFHAVRGLHGWKDGGRQFTNYVAHPMQGAIVGYIYIQNDTRAMRQEFDGSGAYWRSRLKSMAWSAVHSAQFELGPVSQASIGNVGGGIYEAKKMGYVDLVITPTLGTVWLVSEDTVDKYVVRWLERKTSNALVRNGARLVLNPMRSCANMIRFKTPWHRDTRRDGN